MNARELTLAQKIVQVVSENRSSNSKELEWAIDKVLAASKEHKTPCFLSNCDICFAGAATSPEAGVQADLESPCLVCGKSFSNGDHKMHGDQDGHYFKPSVRREPSGGVGGGDKADPEKQVAAIAEHFANKTLDFDKNKAILEMRDAHAIECILGGFHCCHDISAPSMKEQETRDCGIAFLDAPNAAIYRGIICVAYDEDGKPISFGDNDGNQWRLEPESGSSGKTRPIWKRTSEELPEDDSAVFAAILWIHHPEGQPETRTYCIHDCEYYEGGKGSGQKIFTDCEGEEFEAKDVDFWIYKFDLVKTIPLASPSPQARSGRKGCV